MTRLNSIHSTESNKQPNKFSGFINNAKSAIKKTLAATSIAASSLYPASFNSISTSAPLLSSPIAKTITIWTAGSLLSTCAENIIPEEASDTIPPTIEILKPEVNITWWKEVEIIWNQLYIWGTMVASRSDNISKKCSVHIFLNWVWISSGETLNDEWILSIKVRDEVGNTQSADITLNITKDAPKITVNKHEVNIFWWTTVNIIDNQLLLWDEVIASWSDDDVKSCKVYLYFKEYQIKPWDTINEAWKLTLNITNKHWKTSSTEIILTNEAISGLENLQKSSIQVDQEIDLLQWLTFADGVKLTKTEIEIDWERTIIDDPHHYTPAYPWECSIIFTVESKNATTAQITLDHLTIKPLDYKAITINNLKPSDIMPFLWETKNIWWNMDINDIIIWYECIEHLRIPEATKIRDMMREYGAWDYTPEEYQQLMSRLHTGMTLEIPQWYDNYEKIWWTFTSQPSFHAYNERNILNSIVKYATFQIADSQRAKSLYQLANDNPDNIYIFWISKIRETNTINTLNTNRIFWENLKKAWKLPNFIIRIAWTNIKQKEWILKNKIFQKDIAPHPSCVYTQASYANWHNDAKADSHILVTIWTNDRWDVDQTDEKDFGSKFPVWFHPDILFAGREIPRNDFLQWCVRLDLSWKYQTSIPNYVNVAMTDLCFQMFAETKNLDELLDMIRSTALSDYIRFDGYAPQPLQLINPAWFIQKYLMPSGLPTQINQWDILPLDKWYYKWIIFDIPWTEVNIGWEWIAYNDTNKDIIKSQNPFTLQWRLNWDLCKKLWYSSSKPIQWKIIICDDTFNWLNIHSDISIIPNF